MPAIPATWLVGSIEGLAAQGVTVNGGDTDTVPAGNWYLRHPNAALSLIGQLDAVISAELGNALIRIRPDRLVEISSTVPFSLTWTNGPDLPGLLGFSGVALGVDMVHVAPAISPLLFSAGWLATTPVGDGQAGYPVEDEHTQISADGTIVDSEFHNVQTHNEFAWSQVMASRVRASDVTSDLMKGGTWHRFRELVLRPNYRFQVYESVTEDAAPGALDLVSWPTPLGTYKRRALPRGRYDREIRNANTRWAIDVEAIEQPEYPANA
ncbi:MAG: hypothetical protein ACRBN8_22410 [Nannocystales bacterium]